MWVVVFCLLWAFLAYRGAKQKGLNVVLWAGLGLVFGPIPVIVLAFKKSGTSDRNGSFADQAADGIRTIRYSVDNLSSKINESSQGQSANKIAGAMKDAFKKR